MSAKDIDQFHNDRRDLDDPASDGFDITPDDVVNFDKATRAIYVGTTGDLEAVLVSGAVLTFVAVPAGTILPIRCIRVNAAGSTATDLVGLL